MSALKVVDTKSCPKYSLCLDNHWRRECISFNRCPWCGSDRGTHKCNDLDLSRLFVTCPICRFIGHTAKECNPTLIALSQLFGPLRNRIRRRNIRIRRRPVNRRFRRLSRIRRRRR